MRVRRISRRTSANRILPVEAGEVVCPRQGIVDLERCWVCRAYDGLSGGRVEGVVCTADLDDAAFALRPTVAPVR